jgi:hypothetical protein
VATRVVEVVTRGRRAPILEYFSKMTLGYMGFRQTLRHVRQTEKDWEPWSFCGRSSFASESDHWCDA